MKNHIAIERNTLILNDLNFEIQRSYSGEADFFIDGQDYCLVNEADLNQLTLEMGDDAWEVLTVPMTTLEYKEKPVSFALSFSTYGEVSAILTNIPGVQEQLDEHGIDLPVFHIDAPAQSDDSVGKVNSIGRGLTNPPTLVVL